MLHAQRGVPFLPAVGFGHRRTPRYTVTLFQPSAIFWKHCNLQGPVPEATTSFVLRSLIPGSFFFCMSDFVSWDLRREVGCSEPLMLFSFPSSIFSL